MSCKDNGLNAEKLFTSAIHSVSQGDSNKRNIMGGWIAEKTINPKFADYINWQLGRTAVEGKIKTKDQLSTLSKAELKKLFSGYYNRKYPTVRGFAKNPKSAALQGFSSSNAATAAKQYIADLYTDAVITGRGVFDSETVLFQFVKTKTLVNFTNFIRESLSNTDVKTEVNDSLLTEIDNLAKDIYRTEVKLLKSKKLHKTALSSLIPKNINKKAHAAGLALIEKYNNMVNVGTARLYGKDGDSKDDGSVGYLKQLLREVRSYIKEDNNPALIEQMTLIDNLLLGEADFIEFLYSNPKTSEAIKGLSKSLSDHTYDESSEGDSDDKVRDSESNDDLLRNLIIDNITSGNFANILDLPLKQYFNTLINYSSADTKTANRDNALGVPTRMSSGFVIHALCNYGDFNSIESFIESIKVMSRKRKDLAGLITLAEDMENNGELARQIYSNLNLPKIKKAIVSVKEGGAVFGQSNSVIDPKTALFHNLQNTIAYTFLLEGFYDMSDVLSRLKNNVNSKSIDSETVVAISEDIQTIFANLFPNITDTEVDNFLKYGGRDIVKLNGKKDYIDRAKQLYLLIYNVYDSGNTALLEFNKKTEATIAENAKIRRSEHINETRMMEDPSVKKGTFTYKPYPLFQEYMIDGFATALDSLAKSFEGFTTVKNPLNSKNTEGNMGSDIGDSNRISNFRRRLLYEIVNPDGSINRAGAQSIFDEYSKAKNTHSNSILFNQYDLKGKLISKGFFEHPDKVVQGSNIFSENISDILDYYLFNGSENTETKEAASYQTMTNGDYLLTTLSAFLHYKRPFNSKSTDVVPYFMPTPSDSPKNYAILAPKHDTLLLFGSKEIYRDYTAYKLLYNQFIGEFKEIQAALKLVGNVDSLTGEFTPHKDVSGLNERYYYNDGSVVKDGKLTGNVFNFIKLFNIGGYSVNDTFLEEYPILIPTLSSTGDQTGSYKINPIYTDPNSLNNEELQSFIMDSVDDWLTKFALDSYKKYEQNKEFLKNIDNADIKITARRMLDYELNYAIAYMNFEDIYSGSPKFYKSAQDLFKRAKEVQAGGRPFGESYFDRSISDDIVVGEPVRANGKPIIINGKPLLVKDGYNGVTIENVRRSSPNLENVTNVLNGTNLSEEVKAGLLKPLEGKTTIDDAQSYITLDEIIRRRYIDGTLSEFMPLVSQLLDSAVSAKDIDYSKVTKFIQVEKNFYYDMFCDYDGLMKPRQIKNSDYVIIPKFLKPDSNIMKLYNAMIEAGVDQVNTSEADKAAKRKVISFWDKDGNVTDAGVKSFISEAPSVIDQFKYSNLYKQQDVPQHMEDAKNKIAIQVMRKIFINTDTDSQNYKTVQSAYKTKLARAYSRLVKDLGLQLDENGNAIVDPTSINYEKIFSSFRNEAMRLGADSNFMKYFDVENGIPTMPTWINQISTKQENIAQSLFNRAITRQKTNGWHVPQVTQIVTDESLAYNKESGVMEVILPRWSSLIPKDMNADEIPDNLTYQVAYRVPTEGKQSMITIKIVGFLDDPAAKIIVPQEWVTQTGSDFDIDSVYGMAPAVYSYVDDGGKTVLKKYEYDTDESIDAIAERLELYIRKGYHDLKFSEYKKLSQQEKDKVYAAFASLPVEEQQVDEALDNRILDGIIEVLQDPNSLEEMLGRSHFEDLLAAKKRVDNLLGKNAQITSSYNIYDQIKNRDKAQSGAILKATSVSLDGFLSLTNIIKPILQKGIKVVYNVRQYKTVKGKREVVKGTENYPILEDVLKSYGEDAIFDEKSQKVTVNHRRYGWSEDNKNVVGKLITSYSSQTSAHAFDAVKEGALENENVYTFGAFKTLINLGIDFETAELFLAQPAIAALIEEQDRINSNFTTDSGNAINNYLRKFAISKELSTKDETFDDGVVIKKGVKITEFSSNKSVKEAISNYLGDSFDINNDDFTLDKDKLSKMISSTSDLDIINTILEFEKLSKLANTIGQYVRCSTCDKFGAKQTIQETRDIIKVAEALENDDTLTVDGEPFINYLYGEDSKIPYLKAIFDYSTKGSVAINSSVFELESDFANYIYEDVQKQAGVKLDKKQLIEFKKYIVSNVYATIPFVSNPVTVDAKTGEIRSISSPESIWNSEFTRLQGVGVRSEEFSINDPYNPDQEDCDNFAKLSVIQKISFIKKHFSYDSGVFKHILFRDARASERQARGFNLQAITFNDKIEDMESVYTQFNDAFYSKNPLIKLTTLDIIKYALLVENDKYTANSVSKLVTVESRKLEYVLDFLSEEGNVQMRESHDLMGDGTIIFKRSFENAIINDTFEKFIRQRPEVIKRKYLPKNYESILKIENIFKKYSIVPSEEFIQFVTNGAIEDGDSYPKYIRIATLGKDNIYKLYNPLDSSYKENEPPTEVFYIPLNGLDANETSSYSIDNRNNTVPTEEDILSVEVDGKQKSSIEKLKRLKFESEESVLLLTNPSYLIQSGESNVSINNFLNKFKESYKGDRTILYFADPFLSKLFPNTSKVDNQGKGEVEVDNKIIQTLPLSDGRLSEFTIERRHTTVNNYNKLLAKKDGQNTRSDLSKFIESRGTIPSMYIIEPSTRKSAKRLLNDPTDATPDDNLKKLGTNVLRAMQRQNDRIDSFAQQYSDKQTKLFTINEDNLLNNVPYIIEQAHAQFVAFSDFVKKEIDHFGGFTDEDGNFLSLRDDKLYEMIAENPTMRTSLVNFLVDVMSYTNAFETIFAFDTTDSNDAMKANLNDMRDIITSLKNNITIANAKSKAFNIVFASLSNNPNIVNGLISLRTQFGDTDAFDHLFSDIHELDDSLLQAVLKVIEVPIETVRMTTAPKMLAEVTKKIDEIEKKGTINSEHIMKGGRFVKNYNSQFIDDKQKVLDDVSDAKFEFGEYSKEHVSAMLAKDKFFADFVEQEVGSDYYKERYKERKAVFDAHPNEYIKYVKLQAKIADLSKTAEFNESDAELLQSYKQELSTLLLEDPGNLEEKAKGIRSKEVDARNKAARALKAMGYELSRLRGIYFEYQSNNDFDVILKNNLKIIEDYDNSHKSLSLSEKLENDKYNAAYNWVQNNTVYSVDPDTSMKVFEAFNELKGDDEAKNILGKYINEHPEILDEEGNIKGDELPAEIYEKLRENIEKKYEDFDPEGGSLIKVIPEDRPRATKELQASTKKLRKLFDVTKDLNLQINEILKPALVNGTFDINLFIETYKSDLDSLTKLANLYKQLQVKKTAIYNANKGLFGNEFSSRTNKEGFGEITKVINSITNDKELRNALNDIFRPFNKKKKRAPNKDIFGYMIPSKKEDISNTKQFSDILKEYVETEVTSAYVLAEEKAQAEGTYDEWYEKNHILNPFTNKMEPLSYWTKPVIKNVVNGESQYDYQPNNRNRVQTPRRDKINPKYRKGGINYNGSQTYLSDDSQTEAERELVSYLQEVILNLCTTKSMQRFAAQDSIPRLSDNSDKSAVGKLMSELFGFAGFSLKDPSSDWKYEMDAYNDSLSEFNMFSMLKTKASKELLPILPKTANQTSEDYENYLKDTKKKNKEIQKHNAEVDAAAASHDYKEIMKKFIPAVLEYNAKQSVKPIYYLLRQEVKENPAYKLSPIKGRVIKDSSKSAGDHIEYQKEERKNTLDMLNTFGNRFFNGVYKQPSDLNKYANLLQNVTSARYMMFNVTGGIANMLTGTTNVLGETFAKEYISGASLGRGATEYVANIAHLGAGLWKEEHMNEVDGLLKLFNIVDLDKMLYRAVESDGTKIVSKITDVAYSLQSMGEHHMQNAVLLAMMRDHRIFKDSKGKLRTGSFAQYNWHKESEALRSVIENDEQLLTEYNNFIADHTEGSESDLNNVKEVYQFRTDLNLKFLKLYGNRELLLKYVEAKEANEKTAKKEFDKFPNIRSQYEYKEGRTRRKSDSLLTDAMESSFKISAQSVNKKIHGVYDKLGGADIEKKWYGGLVMQYHKHIYPGIMKRYRRKGYYNEFRGGVDKGSYTSLLDLLSTEFTTQFDKNKISDATGADIALQSIKNIGIGLLNTLTNLKLNYRSLSSWEKANVNRVLGDFSTMLMAISAGIGMGLILNAGDEDELEQNVWYNLAVYSSERWVSEVWATSIAGLTTEAGSLYSQPIAAFSTLSGYVDLMNLASKQLFDDDFEKDYVSGRYAGENKTYVKAVNLTPVGRSIYRLDNLARDRNYFDRSGGTNISNPAIDWMLEIIAKD